MNEAKVWIIYEYYIGRAAWDTIRDLRIGCTWEALEHRHAPLAAVPAQVAAFTIKLGDDESMELYLARCHRAVRIANETDAAEQRWTHKRETGQVLPDDQLLPNLAERHLVNIILAGLPRHIFFAIRQRGNLLKLKAVEDALRNYELGG